MSCRAEKSDVSIDGWTRSCLAAANPAGYVFLFFWLLRSVLWHEDTRQASFVKMTSWKYSTRGSFIKHTFQNGANVFCREAARTLLVSKSRKWGIPCRKTRFLSESRWSARFLFIISKLIPRLCWPGLKRICSEETTPTHTGDGDERLSSSANRLCALAGIY